VEALEKDFTIEDDVKDMEVNDGLMGPNELNALEVSALTVKFGDVANELESAYRRPPQQYIELFEPEVRVTYTIEADSTTSDTTGGIVVRN
jgi:hypothetical protein